MNRGETLFWQRTECKRIASFGERLQRDPGRFQPVRDNGQLREQRRDIAAVELGANVSGCRVSTCLPFGNVTAGGPFGRRT